MRPQEFQLLERIRWIVELAEQGERSQREADRLQSEVLFVESEITGLVDRCDSLQGSMESVMANEERSWHDWYAKYARMKILVVLAGITGLVVGVGIMWIITNIDSHYETVAFIVGGAILGTVGLMSYGIRRLWHRSNRHPKR